MAMLELRGSESAATLGRPRRIAVVCTALLVALLVVTPAGPAQAGGACRNGRVALTFDDGPSRNHSAKLVSILANKRARGTFFLQGHNVAARPGRARLIRTAKQKHKIYNHTYTHPNLTTLSASSIRSQVRRTHKALHAARAWPSGKLVRPPYGAIDTRVRNVLRGIGFRTVLWSVDPRDWSSSTSSWDIRRRIRAGLRPGANILLHDQEDSYATVRALPNVIRDIRSRGYCLGVVDKYGKVVAR